MRTAYEIFIGKLKGRSHLRILCANGGW